MGPWRTLIKDIGYDLDDSVFNFPVLKNRLDIEVSFLDRIYKTCKSCQENSRDLRDGDLAGFHLFRLG
jgi:hypothetical protein